MTESSPKKEVPEFKEWPKIHRLYREIIITEKIDGTNAQIYIDELGNFFAGSRTRWVTPESDNFGFAAWAYANKEELMKLGPGRHYGEWWGHGIQRGYGLPPGQRMFSLFNVQRWDERIGKDYASRPFGINCFSVPILYQGPFSSDAITECIERLIKFGSLAAPFLDPEGIVVYHK